MKNSKNNVIIHLDRYESYLRIIGNLLNNFKNPDDILDEFLEDEKNLLYI